MLPFSRSWSSLRLIQKRVFSSSVNSDEIAHFSRLSQHWWDEQGEFSFLHRMNPTRVKFVTEKLAELDEQNKTPGNVLKGLDVLDIGCGGGLLSESLARLGANTLAIDASENNIRIAQHHASLDPRLSGLSYRHTAAETLLEESPDRQFDVVCSMEVLEHVDNPRAFLDTCARLIKPGGHLFLSTIARTPLSYALTILAAEHILRKVTVGTHTYSKFINPTELVDYFAKYGSPQPWISHASPWPTRTEAEVRGMIYVPWSGEWNLMSRGATEWGAAECNYLFWVRKPFSSDK